MKVLITGANGFVGRAIVSELSVGPHELTLLDRPRSTVETGPTESVRFFGIDLTISGELGKLDLPPVDTVIHAAGLAHQFGPISKEMFWTANVDATANVADLAVRSRAQQMILISSVSVYGSALEGVVLRTEDAECKPDGYYAESKLESEKAAIKICEENGIPLTILRLATVIGEGDRGNVYRLIRAIDRRRFLWIGKGENRKSLVYKGDVARACAAVMGTEFNGTRIYNLSAAPSTMKEIVLHIEKALNKKVPGFRMPASLLETGFKLNSKTLGIKKIERVKRTYDKWMADDSYSAAKIETECRLMPSVTVEQAIDREVGWYLDHK